MKEYFYDVKTHDGDGDDVGDLRFVGAEDLGASCQQVVLLTRRAKVVSNTYSPASA